MPRLFWAALGAAGGILAVRKVTRTARQYTPEGIAGHVAGLSEGLKEFAAAVREGMEAREAELRIALGVDTGTLDQATAQELLENPTAPVPPAVKPHADR